MFQKLTLNEKTFLLVLGVSVAAILAWIGLAFLVGGGEDPSAQSAVQVVHNIMSGVWSQSTGEERLGDCFDFYNPDVNEFLVRDVKLFLLDYPDVIDGAFGHEAVDGAVREFFEGACAADISNENVG